MEMTISPPFPGQCLGNFGPAALRTAGRICGNCNAGLYAAGIAFSIYINIMVTTLFITYAPVIPVLPLARFNSHRKGLVFMKRFAVVLVALLVVACQTPAKQDTSQTTPSDTKNAAAPASAVTGTVSAVANEQETQNQSVYFDYATASVSSQYSASIQQQAQSFKGNKHKVVTLEGNCDERGSAEYNLGLGQRRADAVKKVLVAAGVHASQVKTASAGKEKPKATCHDESCWKENRRVDFVQGS